MEFDPIDKYLLGDEPSKRKTIDAVLRTRSPLPAAAPFYRAFEAVGERSADEAFIALRLILAGRQVDDAVVRRLRSLAAIARSAAPGASRESARAVYVAELSDAGAP